MIGLFWVGVVVYGCGVWALAGGAFWRGCGAGVVLTVLVQRLMLPHTP